MRRLWTMLRIAKPNHEAHPPASSFETRASALLSDCLGSQAFCHGRLSLRIALRMVRSFRATAMRATILGLPM